MRFNILIPYWKNKWIELRVTQKYPWHTGIATLCITKFHRYDWYECEKDEYLTSWWRFYPIFGFRKNKKGDLK